MKNVNNFYPGQKIVSKGTCKTEGIISDKYCSFILKFNRKPVNQRAFIPIVWSNGSVGVFHYEDIKAK